MQTLERKGALNKLSLDIQSYLLLEGIVEIFWTILGVQSYLTSAGGAGCLGCVADADDDVFRPQ